jgi:putative glutathione S-transferase
LIGWRFVTAEDGDVEGENAVPDPLHEGLTHLRQIYYETDADYQARFSVPVLYDKIQKTIVNNESSEILRMFGTGVSLDHTLEASIMHDLTDDIIDPKYRNVSLYPEALQSQIDEVHEWHYDNINNGVYKCGIASTQDVYERVVTELFEALDKVENHLASTGGPYWFGQDLTEVDIRL